MRRLKSLLIVGGLALPLGAAAGPDTPPLVDDDKARDPVSAEKFEYSKAPRHARLGVMVINITPELRRHFGVTDDRGILIAQVEPKSAAEAAGIAVGDVLTEVRGTPVSNAHDVLTALAPLKNGGTAEVEVVRDKQVLTLSAKVAPASARDLPDEEVGDPRWPDWFRDFMRESREDPGRYRGPRTIPDRVPRPEPDVDADADEDPEAEEEPDPDRGPDT